MLAYGGAGGATIRPARKRDARPLHAKRAGVGFTVGGTVQHSEGMVEQVLLVRVETVEVALRGD